MIFETRDLIVKESMRKTGIANLGDVFWGTHICLFYETRKDFHDLLVPYFESGLERNEFRVWVTSDLDVEEAKRAMKKAIPGFNRLQLIPSSWQYPEITGCCIHFNNRSYETLPT